MAVVYAATHRNQAQFAIKMLHPEVSLNADLRARFLREGYAANSVKHPGVVLVVDDDVAEDGSAFLVMERLQGSDVDSLWEKNGGVSVSEAMGIVDQLLDVLGAAHEKNIVHRDIKPANLFLTRDGTVKVLDFGIARVRDVLLSGGDATATSVLLGTPAFMAPEQALANTREIDGRTDLWAAGATLFTLISGASVHEGNNAPQVLVRAATTPARSLASVAPDAHPAVVELVAHALAFEKERRFPTAAAMQTAIREAHQAAFGGPPPRASLAALLSGAAPRNQPRPVAKRLALLSTVDAVASDPKAAPLRRHSSAPRWIAAAGVAGLLIVAGVLAIPRTDGARVTSAVPSSVTADASPVVLPSPPADTVTPDVARPPVATAASSVPHGATKKAPVATAAGSSTKPAASATPNCNPNFYFENGVKYFKEECL
ncbi:serine/threonine-protein kinase [soil metagenome]